MSICRFHELSHTHASLLMEQGVDIDSISRRLDHTDSQITRDIYLHVTKKLEDQQNERLKEVKIL
ncbi:MAG TPA: tyrosine-type recombinase/integrase [Candidatus Mediterraneibacter stercorigallinarum]|uniref:Tyrosine-type recombinase/integrase n=1 Tax=Candidatus Mediterraneibacter stercorigallinarum TaxID=2838686 RepID=A0A9D2IK68_9FIRM|nr:tyrosine-type recombinase/integrase [Candidatus Mediterraneibacter stercorigallinarum]